MPAKGWCAVARDPRSVGFCVRAVAFESRSRDGDGLNLEGYAAVFNQTARIEDRNGDFDETILPNAFKRSLAKSQPVLQFEHGRDARVGTVPIGAISELKEDSHGLYVRARLFDNDTVKPVQQAIAGQAIKGMSFRFRVPEGGDQWERGKVDKRSIHDADVFELGPVVHPAYDATTVSVRAMVAGMRDDEIRTLLHELEAHLGLAVDIEDFTGRPRARSTGGGDHDTDRQDDDRVSTLINDRIKAMRNPWTPRMNRLVKPEGKRL